MLAILFLKDRVADLDALVADVDARRSGDQRLHVVPRFLAERAALHCLAFARHYDLPAITIRICNLSTISSAS
jgi:hypothetical protein